MTTYAIANKGDKEVNLWCTGKYKGEVLHFDVINGLWSGKLYPDGRLVVDAYPKHVHPLAEVIWKGEVPKRYAYEYHTAIPWINDQLKSRKD